MAAVEGEVEAEWVGLSQPGRVEIVFAQDAAIRNHTLLDSPVIKKHAQSVVRE